MINLIKKYGFLPVVATVMFLTSCDLFEPLDENYSTFDRVLNEPAYAEGLLDYGYTRIPTNNFSFNDVATDDAVSNDRVNNYMRMATGEWTAMFDPTNQWSNCLQGIQSVNQFIPLIEKIGWRPSNPEVHQLYIRRFKGEAYGLRALLKYHLLVTIAGEGANGQLLGIPIMNEFLENTADFNIPRATFAESINSIYDDITQSLSFLTMDDYKSVSSASGLPADFAKVEVANYNIIFGNQTAQRISGRIVKALRAKVAMLEASPAFSKDPALWTKAATYSGELLFSIGGITGLDPDGHRYYLKNLTDAVNLAATSPIDQKEMIWRGRKVMSNTREAANFPPLLFGNGRINPTQNLVDAFPMANGYPITDSRSQYDPQKPYSGRDPRLQLYVMCNGSTFKGTTIWTGRGGKENAKDSIPTSTRTGYYLKKLLVENVNMNPSGTSQENHYEVHFRYTDFFLMYAEAANEVWGPDGNNGGYGFTARDVIRAIRKRAGITQPDNYLNEIKSVEDMRRLIRNERRLELCFEGYRFWDLRRWKADITETARGVEINSDATEYKYVDVEQRLYKDYMYPGPIPNSEIIKYSNLIQNKGW